MAAGIVDRGVAHGHDGGTGLTAAGVAGAVHRAAVIDAGG